MKLFDYRKSYDKDELRIQDVGKNPIDFFIKWFKEAEENSEIIEPNAMTISTVDENNTPSSRVVLLKQVKSRSLIFFTNYQSNKGKSLEMNKNICASFYWAPLERQVIIKGLADKISEIDSQNYFSSRPFESQVAAIISNQSEPISSYENLLDEYDSFIDKNQTTKLKKPKNWGGIEITISQIEFWQGRKNRLHNRIQCVFNKDLWEYKILSP